MGTVPSTSKVRDRDFRDGHAKITSRRWELAGSSSDEKEAGRSLITRFRECRLRRVKRMEGVSRGVAKRLDRRRSCVRCRIYQNLVS